MTLLLLLASISWGQSTTTPMGLEDGLKLQNVRKDVREILVGRPTVTGLPTFQNGIKFGDGTTQTTAAGTSSSVSIASGASISVSSGATCTGVFCVVASSEPVASTSTTLYIYRTSSTYIFEVNGTWLSSAGLPRLNFNGDTGSNYQWSNWDVQTNDTTGVLSSGDSSAYCQFSGATAVGVGEPFKLKFEFSTMYGDTRRVIGFYQYAYRRNGGTAWASDTGMCRYTGTSNIYAVKIYATAGSFKGTVRLREDRFQ